MCLLNNYYKDTPQLKIADSAIAHLVDDSITVLLW